VTERRSGHRSTVMGGGGDFASRSPANQCTGRVFFYAADLQTSLRAAPAKLVLNLIIQNKTNKTDVSWDSVSESWCLQRTCNAEHWTLTHVPCSQRDCWSEIGGTDQWRDMISLGTSVMAFVASRCHHLLMPLTFCCLRLYQTTEATRSIISKIRSQFQRLIMNAS
jgi:hypothetical protein